MGRRILVVDDTQLNRALAMAMLRREGWEPAEAEDGRRALEMLAGEHGFRAVLLDISMPGMSGEEVCRSLRADPHNAALPLVAYTAHAMEDERERFIACGFNAVLTKPITYSALKDVLSQLIPS